MSLINFLNNILEILRYLFLHNDKENRGYDVKSKKRKTRSPKSENENTPLFMCTRCTKSYRLRHSLTRHMKFECGQEPRYPCELCPKKFKHKYDLTVHMRGKHNPLKEMNKENILDRSAGSNFLIGHID